MADEEVKDFKEEDMIEDNSEEPQEEMNEPAEENATKEEKKLDKEEHQKEHDHGHANKHEKHNPHKAFPHKKAHEHGEHPHEDGTIRIKKKTLKNIFIGILIIAILAFAVFAAVKYWPRGGVAPAGGKVPVEFYVMSQCPYGTQVEDAIAPVLEKMPGKVDFSINFIANDNGDGTFQSLHGQNEVLGDIVQLCAMKYEPENYMDMIVCMNAAASSIPTNWESCAAESKLDSAKIKTCYEGAEGKALLSASTQKSDAVGAQGSPTMYIGGKEYNGARDEISFQRAICAYLPGDSACAGIPVCAAATDCPAKDGMIATCTNPNTDAAKCDYNKAQEVALTIVNDKTCTSCDATKLTATLKQLFPGAIVKTVDVGTAEGKALVEQMDLVYAPAYVFDSRLELTETWTTNTRIQGAFQKVGDSYKILDSATGATHFISAEAQAAYEAEQAAALAEMRSKMGIVTTDNKPQIDFFVMSYCPYGNQAEEAIEPVYQLLKNKAIFNPRYVIYSNYGGGGPSYCLDDESLYCSMHGIQELHQDIREMCVNKYMGTEKLFAFMLAMNSQCSSSNADTCWEAVATGLKLDTTKIKTCQADEGLALVKAQKELGDLAGVSGSPTVFIDGVEYSGARTAEGFKTGLCAAFTTKPSECSTTLDAGAATTPATGGCG